MINEGLRAFTAKVDLPQGSRVLMAPNSVTTPPEVVLSPAGAFIGFVERDARAGELVAVRLKSQSGTKEAIAAGVVTVGSALYGAANGQVSKVVAGPVIGYAITEATAAGDLIEIVV